MTIRTIADLKAAIAAAEQLGATDETLLQFADREGVRLEPACRLWESVDAEVLNPHEWDKAAPAWDAREAELEKDGWHLQEDGETRSRIVSRPDSPQHPSRRITLVFAED